MEEARQYSAVRCPDDHDKIDVPVFSGHWRRHHRLAIDLRRLIAVRTVPGVVLGLVVALALGGCANGAAEAERLGAAFCAAAIERNEAAATAMMTPELQEQVVRLRAFDARFRRQRPGDKPPLGDGLRLTAFPDAVANCHVSVESPLQVVVTYVPAGAPDGGWSDRLLLVRSRQKDVRVGDIAFASDDRVRLRSWLNEAMIE